ncbi:MAG: acyl-CoA desaturase [Sphingobacteriales bacterium]|nr:MAG: acyl-CoA desaturase [Sphingobacteriales bacterium]
MRVKTIVMVSLYFVPFAVILSGLGAVSPWLFYALWITMGIGIVGIGASVMHDSNHGSYSENDRVNNALGALLNLIGGYDQNWKIQHNILHHTYTNLDGLDEDIEGTVLIRMSPHRPLWGIHKYQHIYSWGLYSLMNLMWVFVKDYKLIFRYHKNDLLRKQKLTLRKAVIHVTLIKSTYLIATLGLPLLVSGMEVYQVLLGFLFMHMVAGLSLACIFQPAHVMETSGFEQPSDENKMENSWAVHQLLNTTNFAPKSTVTSWFIGGLNYQIEHHLFPQICHVHYPKLSKIVKKAAEERGLPYNVQPTVLKALLLHGSMLRTLGSQARFAKAYPELVA